MVNSRDKGNRGERELARWLTERGYPCYRGKQRRGGNDSADVIAEGGKPALPGVHVEGKRWARVTEGDIASFVGQAERDAAGKCPAVVFYREDYGHWKAVVDAHDLADMTLSGGGINWKVSVAMDAEDWLEIYKHWKGDTHE